MREKKNAHTGDWYLRWLSVHRLQTKRHNPKQTRLFSFSLFWMMKTILHLTSEMHRIYKRGHSLLLRDSIRNYDCGKGCQFEMPKARQLTFHLPTVAKNKKKHYCDKTGRRLFIFAFCVCWNKQNSLCLKLVALLQIWDKIQNFPEERGRYGDKNKIFLKRNLMIAP